MHPTSIKMVIVSALISTLLFPLNISSDQKLQNKDLAIVTTAAEQDCYNHAQNEMETGECAVTAEKIASKKRDAEITSIMQKWTEPQKSTFSTFKKSAEDFFNKHATSEPDSLDIGKSLYSTKEMAILRNNLLIAVKLFESDKFPQENDFAKADKELNDVYSNLMKSDKINDNFDECGATKDTIKDTQRAWLKYRDSWVKFAALRYPNISENIWKTWLTKQRIEQLKEIQTFISYSTA